MIKKAAPASSRCPVCLDRMEPLLVQRAGGGGCMIFPTRLRPGGPWHYFDAYRPGAMMTLCDEAIPRFAGA